MSEIEIRERVTQYVSQSADDMFLRMIYAMMQEYEGKHVGMNEAELKAYNDEIKDAEQAIERGEFTTQEQLKQDIKGW